MEKNRISLNEFENICKDLPIVYGVKNFGTYLKLSTEIYFKKSESYLTLYLLAEDDSVYLSDSNNVRDICDGYYDIGDDEYENLAKKIDLDYENFRFTKIVNLESVSNEILKFEQLKSLIENY